MINRRLLLQSLLAVTATRFAHATTGSRPLGIQLYMLQSLLDEQFDETLKAVSDIGYTQVELPGLLGRSPQDLLAALKRARLASVSLHAPAQGNEGTLNLTSSLDPLIDAAHLLGCRHLVCSMPLLPAAVTKVANDPQAFRAALAKMKVDDWKRLATFLNKTGEKVSQAGLTFAYHNHNMEFIEYKTETAYDLLLRTTDPKLVKMQLDCAWMVAGKRDPVHYLKKHGERIVSLHVKDLAPGANDILRLHPADVGTGIIDWTRVIPAAVEAGVQYFFVEQEAPYVRSPLDAARTAYQYLRGLPTFATAKSPRKAN